MGDRRCCCACPDWIDQFNRSDSTDIGENWSEVDGDWSIFSNTLKEAGDGGYVLLAEDETKPIIFRPTNGFVYITTTIMGIVDGSRHRIIVNYKDPENYHYAEHLATMVTFPYPWTLTVSLHKVTAGVDTELATKSWTTNGNPGGYALKVCFSDMEFAALAGSEYCVWYRDPVPHKLESSAHPNAYLTGMGNGGSTPIQFDYFYISDHQEVNESCPRCVCRCNISQQSIAPFADLHITAIPGAGCECFVLDEPMILDECMRWFAAEEHDCGSLSGGSGFEIKYVLSCSSDEDGILTWLLTLYRGGSGTTFMSDHNPARTSVCDPLSLVFNTTTSDMAWICFGYSSHDPPIPIQLIITE